MKPIPSPSLVRLRGPLETKGPEGGRRFDADRVGMFASILCAIHCAITPVLLLVLPSFAKIWAHPASHWGMALFVVPVAAVMVTMGYRRHRRKWIIGAGVLGISLVLVGAAIPYLEREEPAPAESEVFVYHVGDPLPEVDDAGDEPFVWHAGEEMPESECVDNCCPSLQIGEDGKLKIHVPLASIVTTLGGLALVATHLGNLCCCSGCRGEDRTKL